MRGDNSLTSMKCPTCGSENTVSSRDVTNTLNFWSCQDCNDMWFADDEDKIVCPPEMS
jgi:transposase-like protein